MTAARRGGKRAEPTPVRDQNLVSRHVAGQTLVMPIRSGAADLQHLYVLNDTAAWLWDQVDGQHSVDQLVQALVAEFDVDEARARQDVDRLLDDLRAEGLVR